MAGARWRVVARTVNEFGDEVFDVYVGGERRAWGMKDRGAAGRWARRLAAGMGAEGLMEAGVQPPGAIDEASDGPGEGEEVSEAVPARRVWWNE